MILFQFIFGEGQQIVIGIGDGEFGGAVECFLEAIDDGDFVVGDHCPDEVVVGFTGDGHDEVEAEGLIKFDGGADIFYEEIGS